MADDPDPERLLADALRAQAARTPLASASTASTPGTAPAYDRTGSHREFELLSGSDPGFGLLAGRDVDAPTDLGSPGSHPRTTQLPLGPEPIRVWWALLLALLLGLAAGAVIGLLTLI